MTDLNSIIARTNLPAMTIPQKIEALAISLRVAEDDPVYDWWGCHWCKRATGHDESCVYIRARQLLDGMGVE